MNPNHKAVFLSYASEDAEAARRLCDAFRAAGIEAWFDESELRGGDAWDQKIRRQIKECALFVPLISATTDARTEGYFRLEWRLAVDRSHLLADDAPFIVPVAIDGSSEAQARVPDRFREVQWMRLGKGIAGIDRGARRKAPRRRGGAVPRGIAGERKAQSAALHRDRHRNPPRAGGHHRAAGQAEERSRPAQRRPQAPEPMPRDWRSVPSTSSSHSNTPEPASPPRGRMRARQVSSIPRSRWRGAREREWRPRGSGAYGI
jgi:hypothetical protein